MNIQFYKYQGTGNDFVLLDNRQGQYSILSAKQIEHLCNRHFGIGADGLILLENDDTHDFKMVYFNSDGFQSSMCGNGGRCIARFAADLKIISHQCSFIAIDGIHEAQLDAQQVSLKMNDVPSVAIFQDAFLLHTGSPHYVKFIENDFPSDFVNAAQKIRNEAKFQQEGINVNFVISKDNKLQMRTYERGVEDETLSCGTGVTAAALASAFAAPDGAYEVAIATQGGSLKVSFHKKQNLFYDIWLRGAAQLVFQGEIII